MDEVEKKTYTAEELAEKLGVSQDKLKPGGGQFHSKLNRRARRKIERMSKRAAKKKGKSRREGKTASRTHGDMEARRKRPIDNNDHT